MKYCSECGSPIDAGDKFCKNCGTRIIFPQQTEVYMQTSKSDAPRFFRSVDNALHSIPAIKQIVNDYTVETREGFDTCIDYIAVTDRGLFIFNLVNVHGKISEPEGKGAWTCDGVEFNNPVAKSILDRESIKSYFIKRKHVEVFPYIVFPDDADLSDVKKEQSCRITNVSSLGNRIEADIAHYGAIYSRYDLQQIFRILDPERTVPGSTGNARADLNEPVAKCVTGKLVTGVLSLVLFIFVMFQSCTLNALSALANEYQTSAGAGVIVSFNLLLTGIIAVAARKSVKKLPWILCAIFLFISTVFASNFSSAFPDLLVWGFLSFVFGAFYLFSCMRSAKGIVITAVIVVLWGALCLLLYDAATNVDTSALSAMKYMTACRIVNI